MEWNVEGNEDWDSIYLIIAVQLQILLWLESVRVWLFWLRLDALGNVSHDFACTEHAVGVQAVVSNSPY